MSSAETISSPRQGIESLIGSLMPGARVIEVRPLAPDSGTGQGDATAKVAGYGLPLRVRVVTKDSLEMCLVFRTSSADDFGHDRPSDRAQGMLLAYDTFPRIPRHIQAMDVGAVLADGRVLSLRDAREHYLLTTYAPGTLYADDLRRIAREGGQPPWTSSDVMRWHSTSYSSTSRWAAGPPSIGEPFAISSGTARAFLASSMATCPTLPPHRLSACKLSSSAARTGAGGCVARKSGWCECTEISIPST